MTCLYGIQNLVVAAEAAVSQVKVYRNLRSRQERPLNRTNIHETAGDDGFLVITSNQGKNQNKSRLQSSSTRELFSL
jgi:hypothetical protein